MKIQWTKCFGKENKWGNDHCFICEQPIKNPDTCEWIELSFKNNDISLVEGVILPDESQGAFPVGTTCAQRLKKLNKERITKEDYTR